MSRPHTHPQCDTIAHYYAIGQATLERSYPDRDECRSILRLLLSETLGISSSDVLMLDATDAIVPQHQTTLLQALERLGEGEPLQYILGHTYFYGLHIAVARGVLIPRPETEELVELIDQHYRHEEQRGLSALDIGTGSGCIPCALARCWGERLDLTAWEISPEAMSIAQGNLTTYATRYGARLRLVEQDLFATRGKLAEASYDLIVSNPPYIHPHEAEDMQECVLNHEPRLALFAPESNPIIYYEAIAELVPAGYLHLGGSIFVELNPLYAAETLERMCQIIGQRVQSARIHSDLSGKERFIHITID